MMKKSYILIILISFLAISPKLYAQVECPCEFESVPKDTECWIDPFDSAQPNYDSFPSPNEECILDNSQTSPTTRMDFSVFTETNGSKTCMIKLDNIDPPCQVPSVTGLELTPEEVLACQCELLAYVTSLNEAEGIMISGGPPYECLDVDCTIPTNVPTLSGWGLISLAVVLGILGIVGFMVMRRRKVNA